MEKKSGLGELTGNLAELSLRKFASENFCSWSEREKELYSWADLHVIFKTPCQRNHLKL